MRPPKNSDDMENDIARGLQVFIAVAVVLMLLCLLGLLALGVYRALLWFGVI